MPISSTLSYVQGLLNGLPLPGDSTPALICQITSPDAFSDPGIVPVCYLWPADGRESRDTLPRNTGPGTASAFKTIDHDMEAWVVWAGADDGTALLFPAMIDAISTALRTAYPMPAVATDPYTGAETQIANIGEVLSYKVSVRPVPDQRNNRYEALLQIPLTEVIQA